MVIYTNNVPQANQKISTTQPIINANFNYIQQAVGQEHNFVANATDPTMTYHIQASMPNLVSGEDPEALPTGTNGLYYVLGGDSKYYNGAANFLMNSPDKQFVLKGQVDIGTISSTVITTMPARSYGMIYLVGRGVTDNPGCSIPFSTGTSFTNLIFNPYATLVDDADPVPHTLTISTNGLILSGQIAPFAVGGNFYNWAIYYFTPDPT